MEQGLTPHQQQALAPYYGVHSLTQEQATTVLRTIWPKAPDIEVLKAATLCKDYGLHPLMKHVFLLPFKNKRTNTVTWSVALGITATRLIASRRRPYAYIDGPRLMTEEEQKKILGEVDQDNLWAITVVQDKLGGQAPGYGKWPKDEEPQGTAKGNSKANMAWIRSERAALGRLLPGEMPGGVDVIDPSFVDSLPNDTIEGEARELPPDEGAEPEQGPPSEGDLQTATARQVDEETGEVTQPSSDDGEGPQRPPSDLKMESLGDLFNASHEYFGTTKAGVLKLLNVRDTSEIADVGDAWATVCAHKLEPES